MGYAQAKAWLRRAITKVAAGAAPVAIRAAGSRLYPPLRTQPEALRKNGQT